MDSRISHTSNSNHEITPVSNSRAEGALSNRRVAVNESPRFLERGGSSIPLNNGQPIADRQIHAQTSQNIDPPNQGENPNDHRSRLRRLRSRIPSMNLQIGERINARRDARASGREVPSFQNALNWRNEMAALEAEQTNYWTSTNSDTEPPVYSSLPFMEPPEFMFSEDKVDPINFFKFARIEEPVVVYKREEGNEDPMPPSTCFYEYKDIEQILQDINPGDPLTREQLTREGVYRLKENNHASGSRG